MTDIFVTGFLEMGFNACAECVVLFSPAPCSASHIRVEVAAISRVLREVATLIKAGMRCWSHIKNNVEIRIFHGSSLAPTSGMWLRRTMIRHPLMQVSDEFPDACSIAPTMVDDQRKSRCFRQTPRKPPPTMRSPTRGRQTNDHLIASEPASKGVDSASLETGSLC